MLGCIQYWFLLDILILPHYSEEGKPTFISDTAEQETSTCCVANHSAIKMIHHKWSPGFHGRRVKGKNRSILTEALENCCARIHMFKSIFNINIFMVNLNRKIWNPLDTTAGVRSEGDKAQTKIFSYHKILVDAIRRKKINVFKIHTACRLKKQRFRCNLKWMKIFFPKDNKAVKQDQL